jgi:hypothetical protein
MKYTTNFSDEECRRQLEELYSGRSVVIPSSVEHAESMLRMAKFYINEQHQHTLNLLKADYDN